MGELIAFVFIVLILVGSFKDRKFNLKMEACHKRIEQAKICPDKIAAIKQKGIYEQGKFQG